MNDSLGHPAGDSFLHDVAANLTASLRSFDVIVRLSGDEFVVLATVDNATHALEIGNRIGWCVKTPTKIAGTELARGASIGVAVMPEDGRDLETLLRKADTAMYQAKHQGGSRVLRHTEQMEAELQVRLDIDEALAQAIGAGQFFLRYQPQVDLRTGLVVGLEALMRWNRPGFGEVQPSDFIAVAEETGHIIRMGEWALRSACEQAAAWLQAGTPVPVSVNVSPVELHRGSLDTVVASTLDRTGLDPDLLVLEITESGLVADTAQVHAVLTRLLAVGVQITIDDFLTGYSNMTYLQKFRISGLKVDRSFVERMTRSPADLAIVGAVVQMARALGISVIAEGVETAEQRSGLLDLGCLLGQGYLFSKPLLVQEASQLLGAQLGDAAPSDLQVARGGLAGA